MLPFVHTVSSPVTQPQHRATKSPSLSRTWPGRLYGSDEAEAKADSRTKDWRARAGGIESVESL